MERVLEGNRTGFVIGRELPVTKGNAFDLIACKGNSSYEIGRQYGEACRENILRTMEFNFRVLTNGYKATKEDVIGQAEKYFPNVKKYDPDMIDQIKGMAEAVGVDWREMFTHRCVLELGLYYPKLRGLCTSFAAAGKATRDGKTLLGQNIDWYPDIPLDLLQFEYDTGVKLLSVSLGGMVEYSLSSAGFGICANSLFTSTEKFQLHLPIGCYLPRVMRQPSFLDAFSLLCQAARGIGYFHLGSAAGEIRGIESTFDDYTVIEPENDLLFHTNCYLTEAYRDQDMAATILPDSFRRRDRMKELLGKYYGDMTPQQMMVVLSDHADYPTSICKHGDANLPTEWQMKTGASLIMVPEDGVLYVAKGTPCEN
jgi:isopenicillin-N N-acyltransferase-like protein